MRDALAKKLQPLTNAFGKFQNDAYFIYPLRVVTLLASFFLICSLVIFFISEQVFSLKGRCLVGKFFYLPDSVVLEARWSKFGLSLVFLFTLGKFFIGAAKKT